MLRCLLIGMIIGVITELGARTLSLWIYRQPYYPVINIIVTFGIIMGGVARLAPSLGLLPAFLIGFAIGLGYEIANLQILDWWYFPGERLAFVHGRAGIVTAIAVLWGIVPVVIAAVQKALF